MIEGFGRRVLGFRVYAKAQVEVGQYLEMLEELGDADPT